MNKVKKFAVCTALTAGLVGVGLTGAAEAATPQKPPLTITWVCPAPSYVEVWLTFSGTSVKGCYNPLTNRYSFFRG